MLASALEAMVAMMTAAQTATRIDSVCDILFVAVAEGELLGLFMCACAKVVVVPKIAHRGRLKRHREGGATEKRTSNHAVRTAMVGAGLLPLVRYILRSIATRGRGTGESSFFFFPDRTFFFSSAGRTRPPAVRTQGRLTFPLLSKRRARCKAKGCRLTGTHSTGT